MGSFTDYLENKLLDHVFGCGTRNYTPPVNIEVALSTTTILDDGTGLTEPTDTAYSRATTSYTDWTAAANGQVSNAVEIVFPQAAADWGTITDFALFEVDSAGNKTMIAYGTLTTAKPVYSGDTAKFAIGDLVVTLD